MEAPRAEDTVLTQVCVSPPSGENQTRLAGPRTFFGIVDILRLHLIFSIKGAMIDFEFLHLILVLLPDRYVDESIYCLYRLTVKGHRDQAR